VPIGADRLTLDPCEVTTYVAFLRAVNVGGKGLLRMADLVDACGAAGCRNVRTFQAAGNVIFEASPARLPAIARRMQQRITALLGAEAGLTIRTATELHAILRTAPFGELTADRALKLYVVFLCAPPRAKVVFPFSNATEALEAIGGRPREVFVVSRRKPRGLFYGFPNAFVEDAVGVPATSRSWSTVARIVAKIEAAGSLRETRPTSRMRQRA
jgi:uncharacterized protein (DUF1697 family)